MHEHLSQRIFNQIWDNFKPYEKYSIAEIIEHKKRRGVYFIFNKKGKIIYIGETKNIYQRFLGHLSVVNEHSKEAYSFDYIDLTQYSCNLCRCSRRLIEREYIKHYNPKYNIQSKNINLCELKVDLNG